MTRTKYIVTQDTGKFIDRFIHIMKQVTGIITEEAGVEMLDYVLREYKQHRILKK